MRRRSVYVICTHPELMFVITGWHAKIAKQDNQREVTLLTWYIKEQRNIEERKSKNEQTLKHS